MKYDEIVSEATDDFLLLEMANLPREDTGVDGIIYISSAQGKHGPRVKWYPAPPNSRKAPCLSPSVRVRSQEILVCHRE